MANLSVKYYSECMKRNVSFGVYLPNDFEPKKDSPYYKRPTKALFLLHGYSGDAWNWVPEYLSKKYNFAVITPNGENGFWLDQEATGFKYCTFVGDELVKYMRRTFNLCLTREDTYIMGLSMGGFGAIHTALTFPETFGKLVGMSSALILYRIAARDVATLYSGFANWEYYTHIFGDPDKLLESDINPETLIKKLLAKGQELPEINLSCGTEDFLLENNRAFHQFLIDNGVEHTYMESAGGHDMKFWDEYTKIFVEKIFS